MQMWCRDWEKPAGGVEHPGASGPSLGGELVDLFGLTTTDTLHIISNSTEVMQPSKDRSTTSCTECQRRKQRASSPEVEIDSPVSTRLTTRASALANGLVIIVKQEK